MPNLPDPPVQGKTNFPSPAANSAVVPSDAGGTIPSAAGGLTKEKEPLGTTESSALEEIGTEVELTPELERVGLQKHGETIELPPDVAKMGVTAVGPTQPVVTTGAVKLPLSDDQIITGLHAQIITSLRWLAEWCIRQLKKAHLHLTKTGGKIIRQQD